MEPSERPLRLVAYLRVSTDKQAADDAYGLPLQEADIARRVEALGHEVVAWYRDEGISGAKDVDERPGLAAALSAIEAGADGLVFGKLDRLARVLHVQEAVLGQVWKVGGRVFSADQGEVLRDDPDDPMRTAMRQMAGVFAELERSMIAARMRGGRRMKAEKGGYAYGAPRFGQRAERGQLVADAEEQATVGRILELRQAGRSLREITRELDAEGRLTKRGKTWDPSTVSRLLRRLEPPAAEAA